MMEMMPGNFGKVFAEVKEKTGGGSDDDAANRMKDFLIIIDSMNPKELASTKVLADDRLRRLARGSGQSMIVCSHRKKIC
jgi:signal recognition particle GTPase